VGRLRLNDHDVTINGINIHYVTWNSGSKSDRPPVLLVHGLTSSSRAWMKLGDFLAAKGWFVIAPDLRGRGLSEKPPRGYGVVFHVNDLLSLCDSLGLSKVIFFGHSLGAAIGLYFCGLFPTRIEKFVLVDAGIRLPQDTVQAIGASLNRLGQVYPSIESYLALCKQIPFHKWDSFWEEYYRYDADVRKDGTVTSRVPKSVIQEEIAANSIINTELLAPLVKVPTLLVRATLGTLGADRGLLLPREEAERLRGIIQNSEIVEIPDTNHYTIVISENFEREVSNFIGK